MERLVIKGYPIIRIVSGKHVDEFLEGSLRFGALKYYRDLEKLTGDNTVGDLLEGTVAFDDLYLSIENHPEIKLRINNTRNNYSDDCALCFFQPDTINNGGFTEEKKRELPKFGNMAVIILDYEAFISRIITTAKEKRQSVSYGRVRYFEKDNLQRINGLLNGSEIGFWKQADQYSYQQEYRILLHCPDCTAQYTYLKIGSIRDISLMIPTDDLLKYSFVSEIR